MPLPPSKQPSKVLAIDTETSGFDWAHGARPFFVTIAYDGEDPIFYQWPVDPLTRVVTPDPADLREIMAHVRRAELVIGHNIRFDVGMLATFIPNLIETWPWAKTRCTLMGDHLLASNQPHNLTDVTFRVLGVDILPAEQAIDEVTKKARDYARRHLPEWMIARDGLACMPSAKDRFHKTDMWLPKALVDAGEDVPAEWATVLSDYANTDSVVTLAVWGEQEKAIRDRKLEAIYAERLKLLPITTRMERRGVTVNRARMREMRDHYATEADRLGRVCVNLAKSMGHVVDLPKSKVNKSVMAFLTSPTGIGLTTDPVEPGSKLIHVPFDRRTETGAVSTAKAHLEHYTAELELKEPRGRRLAFLKAMRDRARRDTAVMYLDGYERSYLPVAGGICRMHGSTNLTGTDTLRRAHKNPNLANISSQEDACEECHNEPGERETCGACEGTGVTFRSLRYGFGPAPGREWWSLDFKNLELRLPFYLSGETELINLFENPDAPPYYGSNHALNMHTVFPEIWDAAVKKVGPEKAAGACKNDGEFRKYYKRTKNGGFAKQYGGGRAKVDATFGRDGAFDMLDARFKNLAKLNRETIAFAERHGYVETIPDRSVDPKRGYPLLCTRTERGKILDTVPLNYKIQGSAMWLTSRAQVRCQAQLDEWFRESGFDAFMTIEMHDELVFDMPKGAIHPRHDSLDNPHQSLRSNLWRVRRLQELMAAGGGDIGIPTPVGAEFHENNWSEGESY